MAVTIGSLEKLAKFRIRGSSLIASRMALTGPLAPSSRPLLVPPYCFPEDPGVPCHSACSPSLPLPALPLFFRPARQRPSQCSHFLASSSLPSRRISPAFRPCCSLEVFNSAAGCSMLFSQIHIMLVKDVYLQDISLWPWL